MFFFTLNFLRVGEKILLLEFNLNLKQEIFIFSDTSYYKNIAKKDIILINGGGKLF